MVTENFHIDAQFVPHESMMFDITARDIEGADYRIQVLVEENPGNVAGHILPEAIGWVEEHVRPLAEARDDDEPGIRLRINHGPVPYGQAAVAARTHGVALIHVSPRFTSQSFVLRILTDLATLGCRIREEGVRAPHRVYVAAADCLASSAEDVRFINAPDGALFIVRPGLSAAETMAALAPVWESVANQHYPELTGWGAGTAPHR